MTIQDIKHLEHKQQAKDQLSDSAARKLLQSELMRSGGLINPHHKPLH